MVVEMARYRQLDERRILETLRKLRDRISERFPESGLRHVGEELLAVGAEVTDCVDYLRKPNWLIRAAAAVAILAMATLLIMVAVTVRVPMRFQSPAEILQLMDAGVNDIVFVGIAVFFLLTIESRMKRRKALRTIHELRSLAHVVDMHQLTKDPEHILYHHVCTRRLRPPEVRVLGVMLDDARLGDEHDLFRDVGREVRDPLEVARHEDQLQRARDRLRILDHERDQLAKDLTVEIVDLVVTPHQPPG